MPDTPLATRAEAHSIFPYPDGQRMMLHVETDRGPITLHMHRFVFEQFIEAANAALKKA